MHARSRSSRHPERYLSILAIVLMGTSLPANLATRAGTEEHASISIRTPLIDLTKREIIQLGQRLGVDYGLTTSCYDPAGDGAACGHCDACQLRLRGFREAGTTDPARYDASVDQHLSGQAAT